MADSPPTLDDAEGAAPTIVMIHWKVVDYSWWDSVRSLVENTGIHHTHTKKSLDINNTPHTQNATKPYGIFVANQMTGLNLSTFLVENSSSCMRIAFDLSRREVSTSILLHRAVFKASQYLKSERLYYYLSCISYGQIKY